MPEDTIADPTDPSTRRPHMKLLLNKGNKFHSMEIFDRSFKSTFLTLLMWITLSAYFFYTPEIVNIIVENTSSKV